MRPKQKNDFSGYVPTAFIVCGVVMLVTGMWIFMIGFHNVDIAWNSVIFRDFYNENSQQQFSWNEWGDNTTSGFMNIKEIYFLALQQLQVGLFLSLIGAGVLFSSVGYIFAQKPEKTGH